MYPDSHPLDDVLQHIRERSGAPERPVVLFDLDSTLIHTGGRHLAILRAFSTERASWAHIAAAASHEDFRWDVDEPLRAAGIDDAKLLDDLHAFWLPRYFDGAWCHHDLPTPGAVDFVTRAVAAGAVAYYLTGRPAPEMGAGTVASLLQLGFPVLTGRTVLHMKPSRAVSDAAFKREALRDLAACGRLVATFENEPAHANAYARAFPDAAHVLIGDIHSPDAPAADPRLLRLPDFTGLSPEQPTQPSARDA